MQVEFKFDLDQEVRIKLIGLTGRVHDLTIGRDGGGVKKVWVQYADKNGAIFGRWFHEDELATVDQPSTS